MLSSLGARHVDFGVLPAHYGIVGEALLHTLQTALEGLWTPRVKRGWILIYGLVSTAMMTGAEQRLSQKSQRREGRQEKSTAPSKEELSSREVDDKGTSYSLVERRKAPGSKKASTLRLAEITGIKGLDRTTPDNSRQERVSKLLDDARNIASDVSESSTSKSTCDPAEPSSVDESAPSNARVIEAVYTSWDTVRKIPNYQEVAGVLLFGK